MYNNAPIKEAVFDIKVERLNINDINELLVIKELLANDFPIEKKKYKFASSFQISVDDSNTTGNTKAEQVGYVFMSEDNTRQIQVGVDGLTLNILKPYENWDIHFSKFKYYLNEYINKFHVKQINRLGLRYINKIELPLPINSFQDYIINMPPIPKSIPQGYSNFFMQIEVPINESYRNIIITETIEPENGGVLPFILDIDVSQDIFVENSVSTVENSFEELRRIKNNIFENCITDKTRNLFI